MVDGDDRVRIAGERSRVGVGERGGVPGTDHGDEQIGEQVVDRHVVEQSGLGEALQPVRHRVHADRERRVGQLQADQQ